MLMELTGEQALKSLVLGQNRMYNKSFHRLTAAGDFFVRRQE